MMHGGTRSPAQSSVFQAAFGTAEMPTVVQESEKEADSQGEPHIIVPLFHNCCPDLIIDSFPVCYGIR